MINFIARLITMMFILEIPLPVSFLYFTLVISSTSWLAEFHSEKLKTIKKIEAKNEKIGTAL